MSQLVLYTVASALLWVFRDKLNAYLEVEATAVIISLLAVQLSTWLVSSVLEGQHKVHISSLLSPIDSTVRSVA